MVLNDIINIKIKGFFSSLKLVDDTHWPLRISMSAVKVVPSKDSESKFSLGEWLGDVEDEVFELSDKEDLMTSYIPKVTQKGALVVFSKQKVVEDDRLLKKVNQ